MGFVPVKSLTTYVKSDEQDLQIDFVTYVDRLNQTSNHGLINTIGAFSKSRIFRVTSARLCSSAVAAMMESMAAIGLPLDSAVAHIWAQDPAVSWVNGRTLSSKPVSICWSQVDNSFWRRELGSLATPRCSSARVIALMKSSFSILSCIQLRTAGSGDGLTSSDNKHVSRRDFTGRYPGWGPASALCPVARREVR